MADRPVLPGAAGFVLKPYRVTVSGFNEWTYYAKSRGSATAKAFSDFAECRDITFKDFLKLVRVSAADITRGPPFGDQITVCGQPGFYVRCDSQYIHFVRPGCDHILCAHPLDVEPPEARKGTPYYEPPKAAA